jgi:general secretion pathway protein D
VGLNFAKAAIVANSMNVLFARSGAPAYGRGTQQQQQPNPNLQQQQQNQQQNVSYTANFTLEQETKEEGYFPWLGGQQENQRTSDGRNVNRQVSDLVGKVRVVPDQRSNSLLISANTHFFPQILKLIEDLDAPTAQVLIEAKILEVSSDFLDKLGVRWSPNGEQVFTADDFDNSILLNTKGAFVKGFGGGLGGPAAAAIANGLQNGAISGTFNLDFLIQFLKKTTDASVLAEPQINIEDNQTGRIFVGQQVPILDNTLVNQVGGQTSGFKYKDVGVILEVTPHINTSGDVSLKIHAESSAIVPGVTVFNGAVFDTRNFKTDLEAKDGQTLVLGGIIQRQVSDTLRKTLFLGDIPGLGWLFKKKDKTTREVELMVFLRPKVVRTPEQAQQLMQEIEKKAPLIKQWEEDFHKSRDLKLKEGKGKEQSSKEKDGAVE